MHVIFRDWLLQSIYHLETEKKQKGNFLPNHSRPDPANIYDGACVGLSPCTDTSLTNTSVHA